MAVTILAAVADMEKRLGLTAGALSGADLGRAEAALADASAFALAKGDPSWTPVSAPAVVATVVLQAALRAYRNPDGFTGESVGDYSWQTSQTATGVAFTPDEVALVEEAAGKKSSGRVGSIRTPSAYVSEMVNELAFWGLE